MQNDDDLELAKKALARGDGPAAVAALNRFLRDRPDHPGGLYLMALCANAAGRADVAIDCLRRARDAAPADPDIAYSLGSLLAPTAVEEALACFRDAVRLRPDFAAAWTNMGNLLAGLGLLEEAAEAYERALAADIRIFHPSHFPLCLDRGRHPTFGSSQPIKAKLLLPLPM